MRSMRSFRHDKDIPFYAYHLETMSPFMLITRPPHNKQTMSPFMLITSGKNDPFYAYQHLISRFMPISVWKKLNIAFTQNRVFFRSGLSGLSFRSRQNTQCDLLGLPVLSVLQIDLSARADRKMVNLYVYLRNFTKKPRFYRTDDDTLIRK